MTCLVSLLVVFGGVLPGVRLVIAARWRPAAWYGFSPGWADRGRRAGYPVRSGIRRPYFPNGLGLTHRTLVGQPRFRAGQRRGGSVRAMPAHGPRAAGSSPNASPSSDISTPHRSQARRPRSGGRTLSEPLRARHGRLARGRHKEPARRYRSAPAPRAGPVSGVDAKPSDPECGPAPAPPRSAWRPSQLRMRAQAARRRRCAQDRPRPAAR